MRLVRVDILVFVTIVCYELRAGSVVYYHNHYILLHLYGIIIMHKFFVCVISLFIVTMQSLNLTDVCFLRSLCSSK